jgi:hypothetical protein
VVGTYIGSVISLLRILPSIAGAAYHHAFDQGQWLLMPEDWILEKYRESYTFHFVDFYPKRDCFPDFPVRLFIDLTLSF